MKVQNEIENVRESPFHSIGYLANSIIQEKFSLPFGSIYPNGYSAPFCDMSVRNFTPSLMELRSSFRVYISNNRDSISWKRRYSSCSNRSCPFMLPVTYLQKQIS